ncbi:transcriptional regulator family: Fungal Specific TF [Penicillium malachiteum]|uniref:transcriptional regulator family: Fungal Specific TF n=1 Tax=Penicillium malachiteum TaxID=1324776 RepID=UPI002547B99D|nr:transcriptional regulator family: Fungal Specific TF [Penicillium malachiteum]KAJ5715785.1 transcriptional regulator family: Fungal Specific TF [Penicillium malachiteum]
MAISPAATASPRLNRACDRCRRRKAKCESSGGSDLVACVNCALYAVQCTFDLPLARRGPKPRRRKDLNVAVHSDSLHSPLVTPATEHSRHVLAPQDLCSTPLDPLSLNSWDNGRGGLSVLDPALSPETVHTVNTHISSDATTRELSALRRWHDLAQKLGLQDLSQDPLISLERMTNRCIEFYFEYLFPLIPLVHEPSLRDGLAFFVTQATDQRSRQRQEDDFAVDMLYGSSGAKYPELWPDATFTLITAVCAEAAFLSPKDIFPEGENVAEAFLQASRDCLASYLEVDIEYPNANSVAIRYFHSNCMHAAGKPRLSWHIFGEATRLAQAMNIHEEQSLQGLSPLEAEFRRRAFWILYIGDKSAAILNSRPVAIHKYSFESGITIGYPTSIGHANGLTPESPSPDNTTTRASFITGFIANIRLWQSAWDLLLELRLIASRKNINLITQQPLVAEGKQLLDHLFILFATCLDDLPPFLRSGHLTVGLNEDRGRLNSLQKLYVIQATNLWVSMPCLKMVITQKLKEFNYYPPAHTEMLLLKKTEIARDMLRVICDAPFWSLQVNGEPCVEKVRLIGARLLEIIDQHEASPLSARARNDLSILLEILTRLDSKASDTLRRSI